MNDFITFSGAFDMLVALSFYLGCAKTKVVTPEKPNEEAAYILYAK